MTQPAGDAPIGVPNISGVVHRRSPLSAPDTVDRLTDAITGAGAKLFAVVDHSGEAKRVGLSLRDTKLLIFGSPLGGTPVMQAAPLAALDLPLKVLVWVDEAGSVWMTYLSVEWLADRYALPSDVVKPLAAVDVLTSHVAASG
jgi:uncharacterized protein (DUF302 family)